VLKEALIVSARQRNIVTSQTVAGDHTACKESGFLMKGRLDLKKIVILTDHPEKHDMLITCLRRLFPECEIQVKPKEMEFLKMSRQLQGLATEDTGEENRKTHRDKQIIDGGFR
jgi:predicted phosphatase